MDSIYRLLYWPGISLPVMGVLVGLWLAAVHGYALLKPAATADFLKRFPRNEKIGTVLMVLGFIWTYILWSKMDLGEFYKLRFPLQLVIIAACFGVITYVKEFLAVRATGFLLILVAAPILVSCFLQEPVTRLLLVALAYAGALIGMFWVGMPYLMRDQINWLLAEPKRFRIGAIAGLSYGVLVLLCAMVFWK